MGGKEKNNKSLEHDEKEISMDRKTSEEKKFVNLLPVYTLYEQKLRGLTKEEFKTLLGPGKIGKCAAFELCEQFMKDKNVPGDISFEKNVGFLSLPRFLPLIALLAERSGYAIKPSLVRKLNFTNTPDRFKEKFSRLLVYGFWYLGRVIAESLSAKEQENMFNFTTGDLGYWWAGVRILDWNLYISKVQNPMSCFDFESQNLPKYRFYSSRAILNMNQHPLYFLTEADWDHYLNTIKNIKFKKTAPLPSKLSTPIIFDVSLCNRDGTNSDSEPSTLSSGNGSFASRDC